MDKIEPDKFLTACANGDLHIIEQFIHEDKYHVDIRNENGWTGLIMACFNENHEIAKLLINSGADINATNSKGTSVFMYAKTPIQKKQTETNFLYYLLQRGANINAIDNRGHTVLDYVKKNGCEILAEWLISMGAK